jgi:dTDP-4-dehydrorhamnose 3,5-epimerase
LGASVVKVTSLRIGDIKSIETRVFTDDRGSFFEAWNARALSAAGFHENFVQDNSARSVRGTLRGLHYQLRRPQGKLVRVVWGEVFDVAVDLRRSSSTFGQWVGERLTADSHRALWIPPGFAHGYLTLSATADVYYKCTEYYEPGDEYAVRWDDPALAIAWPLNGIGAPLLSPRDAGARAFADAETYP